MTEPVDDPYAVLGVDRDATADQIRRAYEAKLNAAAAAMAIRTAQRIDAAYSVLRDPYRRDVFDREGRIVEVPRMGSDLPPPAFDSRTSPPIRQRRRKSRRPGGRGVAVTLAVVLSLAGALFQFGFLRPATGQAFANDVWRPPSAAMAGFPTHRSTNRHRLLAAVRAPAAGGPYAFESPVSDAPRRWDPCAPIRYVVSGNQPFAGASDALTSAIDEVSADTGLQFVDVGTTTEVPTERRSSYQPKRYGNRWAPVLIAWTDPTVVPRLAGNVVGLGGGSSATLDGQARLVSGTVFFDDPDLARMAQRRDGTVEAREVMLHELGHLVGLAHVKAATQVMYPNARPLAHYSAGDRRGLAILGAGPCPNTY